MPARLPVKVLKMRGTYQKSKHAARAAVPEPFGEVSCPAELTGEALSEWNRIVAELEHIGIVGAVEQSLILSAASEWANYWAAQQKVAENVLNSKARNAAKVFHDSWLRCRSKLGLTPVDRNRLRVTPKEAKDQIQDFARKRG